MAKIIIDGKEAIMLDNRKPIFHYETQLVKFPKPEYSARVRIVAPKVNGYKFQFWLSSATAGNVANSYIQQPTHEDTNVWLTDRNINLPAFSVEVTAVYVIDG